jgi:hypothetical protein
MFWLALVLAACSDRTVVIGDRGGIIALGDGGSSTTPPASVDTSGCDGPPVTWFSEAADATTLAPTASGGMIAVGDFNHDGKLDLATAGGAYLGNGDGTLRTPQPYGGYLVTRLVAAGDFNGDGKLDLFTGCDNSDGFDIALGNGDGTFRSPGACTAGFVDLAVVVDLDGDGKLDIVTDRSDPVTSLSAVSNTYVLLGNGDGSFRVSKARDGLLIAVGDFNSDGKPDLLSWCSPSTGSMPTSMGVSLGNGDGTFAAANCSLPLAGAAVPVMLDGSSHVGLAATTSKWDSRPWVAGDAVTLFRGDGGGGFTQGPVYCAANRPWSMVAGDFDGDGKVDVVTAGGDLSLVLGHGDGTFDASRPFAAGGAAWTVVSGDFNSDGRLDLAVTGTDGTVSTWLNTL